MSKVIKETIFEYDENNNVSCCRNLDGSLYRKYEYDSNGNIIRWVNQDNYECLYEYDSNNKRISKKTISDETFYEYHSNGNMSRSHFISLFSEYEVWQEYDLHGNIIKFTSSTGKTYHFENKYDSNDNYIYSRNLDNEVECWREYDPNGNCIKFKNSNGYVIINKYDEHNNLIYRKLNNTEYKYIHEYDNHSNIIRTTKYTNKGGE